MSTWPKTRPSAVDSSTHAANASRDCAARFRVPAGLGETSDKILLAHRLASAGGYEVRHRRVRADRGAVEDGLVLPDRHFAHEAEVFRNRLAGVPALDRKSVV